MIPLQFVHFQDVDCLSIFVEENYGDEDITRINSLSFQGESLTTVKNVDDLKCEHDH